METPKVAPVAPTAPRFGAFVLRNPAVVLTVFYLGTSLIGTVTAYVEFRGFGIHIFDWWEPSDFFLAAFREPWSWVVALLAVGYGGILVWGERRNAAKRAAAREEHRRGVEEGRNWYYRSALARFIVARTVDDPDRDRRTFGVFVVCLSSMVFVLLAAALPGKLDSLFDVQSAPRVRLEVMQSSVMLDASKDHYLLGTSNRYVFIGTQPWGDRVIVVPVSSIIALRREAIVR